MPCCSTLLCWVNPRLPTHCTECGKHIYPQIRSCVTLQDDNATLRLPKVEAPLPESKWVTIEMTRDQMGAEIDRIDALPEAEASLDDLELRERLVMTLRGV